MQIIIICYKSTLYDFAKTLPNEIVPQTEKKIQIIVK
jgi:hypothetical protein